MAAGFASCGSGTTATTVWREWTCSATTSATTTLWYSWVTSDTVTLTGGSYGETAAAREQREAAAKRRAEIDVKAEKWLRQHLSPQQLREYDENKKFTVHSQDGQRRYEIAKDNAWVYELNAAGKRVRSFCIHSKVQLPIADEICAKKVLLESDESAFLKIANATRIAA